MSTADKDKRGNATRLADPVPAKASLFGATNIQRIALVPSSSGGPTDDQALWGAIRNRAGAASFTNFERFVDVIFCQPIGTNPALVNKSVELNPALARDEFPSCYHGSEAYNLLKAAAEVFMALQCGVKVEPLLRKNGAPGRGNDIIPGEADRGGDADTFDALRNKLRDFLGGSSRLYLDTIINSLKLNVAASPLCEGILRPLRVENDGVESPSDCFPCLLELIWSYWHEEGMLVQTLNAICLRFQNKRGPRSRDPLATLRLDPLRPLNTLLWGYIQDEHNRLTVARRAYEYDHEYGLRLVGKAVAGMQPVDSRSKFLESFHNLLSVRHADWNSDDATQANANNWAIYWRSEIQSYIHSYRAVTGVDMSSEVTDTRSAAARSVQPAIHQMRRLTLQRAGENGMSQGRNGNGVAVARNGNARYAR